MTEYPSRIACTSSGAFRNGEHLPSPIQYDRLCVKVPVSGSRVLETGDEDLLKLASKLEGK
jgi:hypothetical protein